MRSQIIYQPREGLRWQAQDKNSGHPSDFPASAKKTCVLYGPGHTSEECKVLEFYSDKYAVQRPQKDKESRSSGKPNFVKSVKFGDNTQEIKIMETYDDTIPKKNNG